MARRLAALVLVAVLLPAIGAVRARAAGAPAPPPTGTPLLDARTHRPLSCPDPSVVRAPGRPFAYYLFCTSDGAPAAFPVYGSDDLTHWTPLGAVFPSGHEPSFALPTVGPGAHGRFWAPSINFIDGRWVLYFSAAYDAASGVLPTGTVASGTMVLGVATSRSLLGPWTASLLHYAGQWDAANPAGDREGGGGVIDPAEVQDPATGQRLLVWAHQRTRIWMAGLSANGLVAGPRISPVVSVTEPWECDPVSRECTVEGPQPLFHAGRLDVLFSGASTWDASYAVGAATATAPFAPFAVAPSPILQSGGGFIGPGGVSDPTTAPDGETVVLYHALRTPDPRHRSGERLLLLGTLGFGATGQPTIGDGTP